MSKLFYNFRTTTLFIQLFFGEGIAYGPIFYVPEGPASVRLSLHSTTECPRFLDFHSRVCDHLD